MKRHWFYSLIIASLMTATVDAQTSQPAPVAPAVAPAAADTEQQVERWIKDLSHDNWAERQAAEDGLIELGDAAVPHVRQLLEQSDDPNLLASAENILAQIERLRLEGPTRITVHLDNASPRDVIDTIVQQCGHPITVGPERLWEQLERTPVTLHFDRAPLWQVLRELCLHTNLRIHDMNQPRTITLTQSGGGDDLMRSPFHQDGPFMVIATTTHEQRTLQLGRPNQPSIVRGLQMTAYVEPKLAIVGRAWQPVIEELIGDDGKAYPIARNNSGMNVGRDDWMWNVGLVLPTDPGLKKIAKIKGYLPVLSLVRAESRELDLAGNVNGSELEIDGHRLVVHDLQRDGDTGIVFKLTLHARGGRNADDPLGHVGALMESISVVDAAGQALSRIGTSGTGNNQKYDYEVRFSRQPLNRPVGPAAKLVWRVPLEARELKVPFEFTDIPMP